MTSAGRISLESIERYNYMFQKAWGWMEYGLIVKLDELALAKATPKKPNRAKPGDEPEAVPVANAVAIRGIFRSIKVKKQRKGAR